MEQRGDLSDTDLVRWALGAATPEQRKAAFEAIADRHHQVVFRQCARWFPHPEEARDVGQAAFEAAFTLLAAGRGPERPDKLAGWLIEIAKRRGQEYRRKDRPAAVSWAILPEGQSLDQIEDDAEPRSGSAVRRAHATRLVEAVAATLTARQQKIYQLRYVEELTGVQVAERLGITSKTAGNEIGRVQDLIANGFGALILFQEGRRYCAELAGIIETAPDPVGTAAFTTALRERIVHHFDNCNVCDDCRTCNNKRRELVGPYVPALIPILFAADLRDRIAEVIERITGQAAQSPPGVSGPGAAGTAAVGATAGAAIALDALESPGFPAPEAGQPSGARSGGRRPGAGRRRAASYAALGAAFALLGGLLLAYGGGTLTLSGGGPGPASPGPASPGGGGPGPGTSGAVVAKVPPAGPSGWADGVLDDASPTVSVSCPTSSFCLAADNGYNSYVFNGSTWTGPIVIDSAAASAAGTGNGPEYVSVSCATPQFCAAVDNLGHLYTFNGSSWSGPQTLSQYGGLSISCPVAGFCLAVDVNGYAYTYSGGTWTTHKGVAAEAENTVQDGPVYQVSCASASFCALVSATGTAQTYNGTTWSSPVKVASPDLAGDLPELNVSCPSATFCMAIDPDQASYTFDGTSWKISRQADGPDDRSAFSCPSASFCMTLDSEGNLFRFNGSAWNPDQSFRFADEDGDDVNVSCPSAGRCVAVGDGRYAIWR